MGLGSPTPAEQIQENKSSNCLLDQFSHSHSLHLEEYQRPPRPEASTPILSSAAASQRPACSLAEMNPNTVQLSLTAHAHGVLHPVSSSCPEGCSCPSASAEDLVSPALLRRGWAGPSKSYLSHDPVVGGCPPPCYVCVSLSNSILNMATLHRGAGEVGIRTD